MNPSGDDKKYEPSPETNPEPDKPTGSEEEEKEPEKKEEKNPSEKPNEEEKGGFGEWFWTWYKNNLVVAILLTILSAYLIQIIIRVIIWGVIQQKGMSKYGVDGICLRFASKENDGSIEPLGIFKNFTNKDRFQEKKNGSRCTITYSGLKRIGINALAAATLTVKYRFWLAE